MEYDAHNPPGGWVLEQAAHHERRLLVLLGFVSAVVLTTFVLAFGHVLTFGSCGILFGVLLLLRWYTNDTIDEWARWRRGGLVEEKVGRLLDELIADGCTVVHDLPSSRGGNIDHLVNGPYGVFLVETKSGGWATPEQVKKAAGQAAHVHRSLGVWISAVICLDRRRGGTSRQGVVTMTSTELLLEWIKSQRNPPADPERFRRFVDGV